ncbi:MAG: conjugal transfer protein TraX [Firmicutes bacterium]|nr:conjugal transfer protein TraX [Bacillota bacterium]MCL1954139.1 conjugal transfer protein TraX [Bacillota bacterium]
MLIDHIGYFIFPNLILLRIVGRIAFPLFAFLIAFGATKTRNLYKYFFRLLVFAIVVQLIIFIVSNVTNLHIFENFNVFFTLAGAVGCIILNNSVQKYLYKILISIQYSGKTDGKYIAIFGMYILAFGIILFLSTILKFDYGIAGIILIYLFYLCLVKSLYFAKQTAVFVLLLFNILMLLQGAFAIQILSIVSIIFIIYFSDKKLKISKLEQYAFYIFYPLHLVIINSFLI